MNVPPNFQEEKDFFSKFEVDGNLKYLEIFNKVTLREVDHIQVDLDDVDRVVDQDLCNEICKNTKRYNSLFYQVVDEMLPDNDAIPNDDSNPLEVLLYHRSRRNLENEQIAFPPALTRRYTLSFAPLSTLKKISVREIKGSLVGKMVKVRGMVTRVSNVKPLVLVAAYSCDKCGSEVFQDVASQEWTPLSKCEADLCKRNNSKGVLHMQTRGCKFLKFQEVKLQELPDQIPMGHIPRYMTIHLVSGHTRKLSPGETVEVSGVILPLPYTGFKALRAGLITDTYLEAHHIIQSKKKYSEMVSTEEITQQIYEIHSRSGAYHRLANSIAPEIYGHEDVKKALLLMLVSGHTKETLDGMKVRGDINICLMGDPGVAKSQLLKYISKVAPRGVYTTGRGSSGVGLTASVMRDPVTDEMVLEGGALVLADNGIACIDEFDKMDDTDRTAIHEVMEQQTISISKAGISTTLNARTSILAAANPQYGRYNPKLKPTDNINLPAALLSRFDLLFLLLDTPNMDDDVRLAQHVTFVHKNRKHPDNENMDKVIDLSLIKHYISHAKTFSPVLVPNVADYVVNAYVDLRKRADETSDFQYTCARTLLSVIRLASALTRLRFSEQIEISDIDEALRLIDASKASLHKEDNQKRRKDPISVVFEIIKQMCMRGDGTMRREVNLADVQERIVSKGISLDTLTKCVQAYSDDDVWMVAGNGSKLRWMRISDDDSDEEE